MHFKAPFQDVMIFIPIIAILIRSGTQLWGQAREVVHNIVTYLKKLRNLKYSIVATQEATGFTESS